MFAWTLPRSLRIPGATIAAALFAVHPVHVEAVAWIAARKDLLATTAYLGALIALTRYGNTARTMQLAAGTALCIAALLAKSIAVTAPATLAIIWYQDRRLERRHQATLAALTVVGATIASSDLLDYRSIETLAFDHGWIARLMIASEAIAHYAGQLIVPVGLSPAYPTNGNAGPLAAASLGALLIAAGVAERWFPNQWKQPGRVTIAATAIYIVTLAPTLGFARSASWAPSWSRSAACCHCRASAMCCSVMVSVSARFAVIRATRRVVVLRCAVRPSSAVCSSSSLSADASSMPLGTVPVSARWRALRMRA